MPGESKTSPRRLAAAERQRQALALRVGGASFEQIAAALGYKDKSGGYRSVMAALARVPEPEAKVFRIINLERLNQMRLRYWATLQRRLPPGTGLPESDLALMRMELAIQEREAKYLGLDAPEKRELTGPDGGPIELAVLTLSQRLQRIIDAEPTAPMLPEASHNGTEPGGT